MSWQEYQNNDKLEQEQLDVCRALIGDATKDTTLWLHANPSAEEQVHVLAIQTGLADLARIIERRMERRKEAKDDWEYSKTVSDVLSRLDKARDVRGNIVGKGLARLADHLPKGLPGKKAPKPRLPEPVKPVNTSGSIWLGPPEPKPTQIPPNPPTYFPRDLWPRTCVILVEAVKRFPDRKKQMPELCRHVISEMTPIYCEAVKSGGIKADAVLREHSGGMADLLHSLLVYNDDDPHSGFSSLSNEAYRIYEAARNSEEWGKLAKAIAGVQVEMQPNGTGADRFRTDGKQTESSRAQNNAKSTQGVESKSTDAAADPPPNDEKVNRSNTEAEFGDVLTAIGGRRGSGGWVSAAQGTGVKSKFTHSEDYRSVTVRGVTYTLTSRQAQMIQILDEARTNGSPDVGSDHIMVKLAGDARGETSRWQDTWKSSPKARKALIKSGTRKGTLRLNL